MTLKRLLIVLAVLIVLAGGGMMWLGWYAYTPQGRARIIITQLKGDTTSLRGWLLKHHVVRQGFTVPPDAGEYDRDMTPAHEMLKLGREVLPVLIEALQDSDCRVRSMAIWVCGELRDPAAIGPLAKCMRDESSKFPDTPSRRESHRDVCGIQISCLESLGQIGPEAFGPLLEAVRQCDPDVRSSVPLAAGNWGLEAVPRLIELIDDSDSSFHWRAAQELGRLKDKRATDALVRHLSAPEKHVGASAAEALGEIGDRKAIPGLLKALTDKDNGRDGRCMAAGALARMGQSEGIEYLRVMAKSYNPIDRQFAGVALGNPQIKGALDPLLSLLGDKESFVRVNAVASIRKLQDRRAIPAIRKLLKDPDFNVVFSAEEALKELEAKLPPASKSGKP